MEFTQKDRPLFNLATFAGGCFWCITSPFKELKGVQEVISGYTGGDIINPTYEDVCSGVSGHYEVVQIKYDPLLISYTELLNTFWQQIYPAEEYHQNFNIKSKDHYSRYSNSIGKR